MARERAGRIVKRQDRQTYKKEGGQAAKQVKRGRLGGLAGKKEGEADAYKEHLAHWQTDKRQAAGMKSKRQQE